MQLKNGALSRRWWTSTPKRSPKHINNISKTYRLKLRRKEPSLERSRYNSAGVRGGRMFCDLCSAWPKRNNARLIIRSQQLATDIEEGASLSAVGTGGHDKWQPKLRCNYGKLLIIARVDKHWRGLLCVFEEELVYEGKGCLNIGIGICLVVWERRVFALTWFVVDGKSLQVVKILHQVFLV